MDLPAGGFNGLWLELVSWTEYCSLGSLQRTVADFGIFNGINFSSCGITRPVKPIHFGLCERTRTSSAKDHSLVSCLINNPIAIEPPRNRDGRRFGRKGGYESGIWDGTEPHLSRHGIGRYQLHDTQAVFSISNQSKLTCVNRTDLDRARIV